MLDFLVGLALIAGLIAAWAVALYLFTAIVFGVSRLIPWVGRKHKHDRWNQLNRIEVGAQGARKARKGR